IVPLRTVTFVCPPVRTPTESSWGSGQVCGPIPGPVIVRPPRSRVMLSALMTKASVVQVMSFARRKSVVTRWPHCALCAVARIAGHLEGTLRVPDGEPRAIVVIAHPLPTHGGEMRNPLVAGIARACAERGWYALRFNFRGVGASDGIWTGGRDEAEDVGAAVAH